MISRPGASVSRADRRVLAGAGWGLIYLWVPIDRDAPPASSFHRLTVELNRAGTSAVAEVEGSTVPVMRDRTTIGPPLRGGPWRVGNGPSNTLDIGGGAYAMYAHLKPASLRVAVGDRVKRGQVIGLLGNSGNSSTPHLPFQIQDTSVLSSEGLPYVHGSFELVGQCDTQRYGRCERKPTVTRRNEILLDGMLVQFAPVRFSKVGRPSPAPVVATATTS